jgi:hypothetical protein
MRETFTSGSVGRAPGNRCLYPEGDGGQPPLRCGFQPRLMPGVRLRYCTFAGSSLRLKINLRG